MADGMRPLRLGQAEAADHIGRQPRLLEDFDELSRPDHPDLGVGALEEAHHGALVGVCDQHRMAGDRLDPDRALERLFDTFRHFRPINRGIVARQGQLDLARLDRVAIDGEPCRIRATAAHLHQHRRKQRPELGLEAWRFEVKSDNAAHRPETPALRR